MPYAGSSSEWNTPATPANFAAPANSLPRRGICAPSASNSLTPIRPLNPGKGNANIIELDSKPDLTILDSQDSNEELTSTSSNFKIFETSSATLGDSILLSGDNSGSWFELRN